VLAMYVFHVTLIYLT